MANNIDQRSIDQANSELRRVDAAIEDALMKLRKATTVPDAVGALNEARRRLALAQRHLK